MRLSSLLYINGTGRAFRAFGSRTSLIIIWNNTISNFGVNTNIVASVFLDPELASMIGKKGSENGITFYNRKSGG